MSSKNVVILCDGTWMDEDDTSHINVLGNFLENVDRSEPQVFKYFSGVGTDGCLGERLVGAFTGDGLDDNIKEAYKYLASEYCEGDKIFLFGFSRGAYTVRSLAGLIRKVGLLKSELANKDNVDKAYELYRDFDKHLDHPDVKEFKEKSHRTDYSHGVTVVHFLGVYDTVGALGIPSYGFGLLAKVVNCGKYNFHSTALGSHIKNARHALAIDEHREEFKPSVWTPSSTTDSQGLPLTNSEQRWFAGVHADIGGGYEGDDGVLSNIPFKWMTDEAKKAGMILPSDFVVTPLNPLAKANDSSLPAGVRSCHDRRMLEKADEMIEDGLQAQEHSCAGHRQTHCFEGGVQGWNDGPGGHAGGGATQCPHPGAQGAGSSYAAPHAPLSRVRRRRR